MEGHPNPFRGWFEECEEERFVKKLVGKRFDKVDRLKVKKYGGTHIIYGGKDELA